MSHKGSRLLRTTDEQRDELVRSVARIICERAFGYTEPMESDLVLAEDAAARILDLLKSPTEEMVQAGLQSILEDHGKPKLNNLFSAMVSASPLARTRPRPE
jgi:hypothetical protein